jgi:hypothetical protein
VGMFTCGQPATIGITQLRPGYTMQESDSSEPFLVLVGVCRDHVRVVRAWLRETWPHDEVDVYGLEFLVAHLEGRDVGVPVMGLVNAG